MPDNKKIAKDVLDAVGGSENVASVAHCMTRLRFTLKDAGIPDKSKVESIPGVVGVRESGGQFQVVIGQNVPKVYEELCTQGKLSEQVSIDENLDAPDEPLTPRVVGKRVLSYLSGSMVPLIPILIVAGMAKTLGVLFGPTMLNLIGETSDLYVLSGMIYNASFYFIPIYLGYTAAKAIGASPALGMLMGGILVEPTLTSMVAAGTPFSVYGIPVTMVSYAQTVIPILLSVWVMSYFERIFRKYIPDALSTIFVPFLTIAVMIPIALCLLGPIGSWLGELVGTTLSLAKGSPLAPVAMMVLSAFWSLIVMMGMHIVIITIALANLAQVGYDDFLLVSTTVCCLATSGAALGAFLRIKAKGAKGRALSYFVSNFVGGVGEPFLYGLALRYKRLFLSVFVSGAVGALIAYLLGVKFYVLGSSNFLVSLAFVGGGTQNFVAGTIACWVVFAIAVVMAYFTGFTKEELAQMGSDEANLEEN